MTTLGTTTGPLSGIRILELSIAATGPFAVALLADQGATVVKVERPGIGDLARWVGCSHAGMSALYLTCNRGKRSIAIDITTDEGAALVRRLAAEADVLVENYRPGVLDRRGLGADALRAEHPDLVYVSISGFGPVGPYAGKSAYDTVIQSYAGLAANQADPDTGAPVFLRQTAADKITALTAAQAITAALLARERGHGGQHLHLSMLDAVVSFLWVDTAGNEVLLDSDGSMPSNFVSNFAPMPFADGYGIATPTSDADFQGICRALGVEGADDPAVATMVARAVNKDAMQVMMTKLYEASAQLTTAEAIARLEAERVPCGVIIPAAELPDDPHARAIGLFVNSDHPTVGRVRLPRHPTQFSATPAAHQGPSPTLGEHTDAILAELGMGEQTADLRARGVVA